MSLLGNILWIIVGGGIVLFFEYLICGALLCMTIVGIPFGIQCMKLSFLALVPFGKEIREAPRSSGCLSTVMNVIWVLLGGILITMTHLFFALVCAITVIGIPFAVQHMKLALLALVPFGKEVVDVR
ncbi:MAG: YccF domain-containing protein [candidate division Zixibacteria bacterium]|nr:YccF domain-containing protein [candidate division Zixibacteria bacterium]MDH3936262.1 YccF domain-containing protein [candidate division Zixibacteria bacterium]MDH4034589.1 YccF domain-containing protein [candidate division Zixibacteria bacterium]